MVSKKHSWGRGTKKIIMGTVYILLKPVPGPGVSVVLVMTPQSFSVYLHLCLHDYVSTTTRAAESIPSSLPCSPRSLSKTYELHVNQTAPWNFQYAVL